MRRVPWAHIILPLNRQKHSAVFPSSRPNWRLDTLRSRPYSLLLVFQTILSTAGFTHAPHDTLYSRRFDSRHCINDPRWFPPPQGLTHAPHDTLYPRRFDSRHCIIDTRFFLVFQGFTHGRHEDSHLGRSSGKGVTH